jgi:hypothetical protein
LLWRQRLGGGFNLEQCAHGQTLRSKKMAGKGVLLFKESHSTEAIGVTSGHKTERFARRGAIFKSWKLKAESDQFKAEIRKAESRN